MFNKNKKTTNSNNILKYGTLDVNHKAKLDNFNNDYNNKEKIDTKIKKLKEDYEKTTDIIQKTNIKDKIEELEKILEKIDNQDTELDYYSNTIDILINYYDNKNTNKAVLLNNYMKIVDKKNIIKETKNQKICKYCNNEKSHRVIDGCLVCSYCGDVDYDIVDSDKSKINDTINEPKLYMYKRSNHLSEILNQCQGKESTDIPDSIYDDIKKELKKNKITDLSKITKTDIKKTLKSLNLSRYYEHIPHIVNKLNGVALPVISRNLEEKVKQRFKDIQEPFAKFKPKNKKNLISYCYLIRKILELLDEDELAKQFPLLKSREKLKEKDETWKLITEYLGWEFIRSV